MKNTRFALFFTGILSFSAIAASLTAIAPAQAFNIQVFTDKDAWIEALGDDSFKTEDFSNDLFDDFDFVSGSGEGEIQRGEYQDRLIPDASTTFSYLGSSELTAFGGEWDTGRRPRGLGIAVSVASGETYTIGQEISNASNFDFFGFVSDTPFEEVILNAGTQNGVAETFNLDNVVYNGEGSDPIPGEDPVPEPTTVIGSFVLGLMGMAAKRKKRLSSKKTV